MKVTDHLKAGDFAVCMGDLVDIHDPDADSIHVVLDKLSSHSAGALCETFPAPEALRILRYLDYQHTLKHASWLNMVEIEIGVPRSRYPDRRTGERNTLEAEIAAWNRQRDASGAWIQ